MRHFVYMVSGCDNLKSRRSIYSEVIWNDPQPHVVARFRNRFHRHSKSVELQ